MQDLRRRLRREDGFTMIVAMLGLLIVGLASFAAYTAVMADSGIGVRAKDQKLAYTAADAGMQWYQAELAADPNYWTKCTGVPTLTDMPDPNNPGQYLAPVNQPWNGVGADPRKWRTIPGSDQQYTVELLPVSGATCDGTNPTTATTSMLDPATRTFRVRVSGRARAPVAGCGVGAVPACPKVRSVIGTFRRRSFLDYLYYSNYEELDPRIVSYGWGWPSATGTVDPATWAKTNCKHYWEGRDSATYAASLSMANPNRGPTAVSGYTCPAVRFAGADSVAGPLHSEDSLLLCGTPTFGRNPADPIEIANGDPDNYASTTQASGGSCAGSFSPTGTANLTAPPLPMPTDNTTVANSADILYTGKTTIVLNGAVNTMTVTNAYLNGGSPTAVSLASASVVFVRNDTSAGKQCSGYFPNDPYNQVTVNATANNGCGDLTIKGTYSKSLTFGSADDIIVNGDITNTNSGSVAGLIANNFVRVYHPVNGLTGTTPVTFPGTGGSIHDCSGSNTNTAAALSGPVTIKAAIVAVNDSFMVDNFLCGTPLGSTTATGLTVNGAIAQAYRGPVGYVDNTGTITHGYLKNYTYDDRLHSISPPKFLDPAAASWNIARVTEQVPATG